MYTLPVCIKIPGGKPGHCTALTYPWSKWGYGSLGASTVACVRGWVTCKLERRHEHKSAEHSWHPAHHCHCYSCPLPSLWGSRGLRSWRFCERCICYPTLVFGKDRILKRGNIHMICAVYEVGSSQTGKTRETTKQADRRLKKRRQWNWDKQQVHFLVISSSIWKNIMLCEFEVKVDLCNLPWPRFLSNLPSYERQMQLKSSACKIISADGSWIVDFTGQCSLRPKWMESEPSRSQKAKHFWTLGQFWNV